MHLSHSAEPDKWQTLGLPANAMWISVEVIDCSNFFNNASRKGIILNLSVQLIFNSVTLYMY